MSTDNLLQTNDGSRTKKTILITGGAGFIGSNLVRHLYEKYPNYSIIVLDVLTYAGDVANFPEGSNESNRFEFWYGDICNAQLVDSLVARSDIVIHMAAESHVTRSIYDNRNFFMTDVIGTQTVANSIVKHQDKIERFIHISTSEVYGTACREFMDEEHPLMPLSPYASAKCGADRLVYSYWATYHIPAIIIRPFNNYGPQQHLEKAIPRFVTSCILGESLRIHGAGDAERDWIFVQDTCEGLDCCIHADLDRVKGHAINLGTGRSISIRDVAETIIDQMGYKKDKIKCVTDRPGQVQKHIAGIEKAIELIGFKAKTPFEDGIDKTIEWYLAQRDLWKKQMWMRAIPITVSNGRKVLH